MDSMSGKQNRSTSSSLAEPLAFAPPPGGGGGGNLGILAGQSGFTRAWQGSRNRGDGKNDFVEGGTAGAIPRVFMKLGEGG